MLKFNLFLGTCLLGSSLAWALEWGDKAGTRTLPSTAQASTSQPAQLADKEQPSSTCAQTLSAADEPTEFAPIDSNLQDVSMAELEQSIEIIEQTNFISAEEVRVSILKASSNESLFLKTETYLIGKRKMLQRYFFLLLSLANSEDGTDEWLAAQLEKQRREIVLLNYWSQKKTETSRHQFISPSEWTYQSDQTAAQNFLTAESNRLRHIGRKNADPERQKVMQSIHQFIRPTAERLRHEREHLDFMWSYSRNNTRITDADHAWGLQQLQRLATVVDQQLAQVEATDRFVSITNLALKTAIEIGPQVAESVIDDLKSKVKLPKWFQL